MKCKKDGDEAEKMGMKIDIIDFEEIIRKPGKSNRSLSLETNITDYLVNLTHLGRTGDFGIEMEFEQSLEECKKELPKYHWKLSDYWIYLVTHHPIFSFPELSYLLSRIKSRRRKIRLLRMILTSNLNRFIVHYFDLNEKTERTKFLYLWPDDGIENEILVKTYDELQTQLISAEVNKLVTPKTKIINGIEQAGLINEIDVKKNKSSDKSKVNTQSEKLLTINDLVSKFAKSRQTIYAWIKKGILKPVRIKGTRVIYFNDSDVEAAIQDIDKYFRRGGRI